MHVVLAMFAVRLWNKVAIMADSVSSGTPNADDLHAHHQVVCNTQDVAKVHIQHVPSKHFPTPNILIMMQMLCFYCRPGIDLSQEPPAVRMNDELGGILTYKLKVRLLSQWFLSTLSYPFSMTCSCSNKIYCGTGYANRVRFMVACMYMPV